MPICEVCGSEKTKRSDNKGFRCKECHRRESREWRRKNIDRCRESVRAWHRNNLERHKEMSDKWLNTVRESGLTNKRVQALKNKYGLTEQQYLTILQQQDYKCVICETPVVDTGLRAGRYSATIDHNHINGAVRGILCNWCNTSIARFNDEPAMLHRAAKYLEERGEGIPLPPS